MKMKLLEKNSSYPPQLRRIAQYLIPVILLVLLGFLFFSSAGRDDAYITYWPAYSLAHFGEILNYNGDRVEQSSSLLHVLVLAVINVLSGINIASLGTILSVLCGAASLVAVYRLSLKIHPESGFSAALLTGTSAYFIYWSFGGLESTLVCLTSLWLILSYGTYLTESRRMQLVCPITATALFAIVRPEMPIVLTCMLIGAIVVVYLKKVALVSSSVPSYQKTLSRLFVLLGISTVICVLVFTFRIWYFGSLFPQPVFAKSAGISWMMFKDGAHYFIEYLLISPAIAIITLVSVCSIQYAVLKQFTGNHDNPYILLSLLFLATYVSFILFSGGDWMESGRFLVHMLPVAVMFIPFFLNSLVKSKLVLRLSLALLFAVQVQTIVDCAKTESCGMHIRDGLDNYKAFALQYGASDFSWFDRTNRVHMRDIPTIYYLDRIVERLLAYKDDEVHIMSAQMGMVSYYIVKKYFGRIRTIDRRSLVDRFFTKCNITSGLPRSTAGLLLSHEFYFENREAIEKKCGMTRPDIIFGLITSWQVFEEVVKHGYMMIYVQSGGRVHSNSKWLPGAAINQDQFIAVRREFEVALADLEPVGLDFQQLQAIHP